METVEEAVEAGGDGERGCAGVDEVEIEPIIGWIVDCPDGRGGDSDAGL